MTRMDEATARQRAKEVLAREPNSQELIDFAEYVLATTGEPTMADVEWDDEKHHMAGATLPGGGEVVMVWPDVHNPDLIITKEGEWARKELTPNGKRYELREVGAPEQPEHPATLETLEDYENAPVGTIVAYAGCSPYLKKGPDKWEDTHYEVRGNEGMSGVSRQMLRRGWGE